MKYKLLPCPHCQGEAHFALLQVNKMISNKKTVFIDYDAIQCEKCMSMAIGNTVDEVVERWNRREEVSNGD